MHGLSRHSAPAAKFLARALIVGPSFKSSNSATLSSIAAGVIGGALALLIVVVIAGIVAYRHRRYGKGLAYGLTLQFFKSHKVKHSLRRRATS